MGLNERLMEEMKAAMKAGDAGRRRLESIRFLRSAIKNAEIEKRAALSDDEILALIQKQVKQLRESLAEFEKGGRPDLVEKARGEIEILSGYLPQQLTEVEIREIARKVIEEVGAQGARDLGKVMGPVVALTRGRADGRQVNEIVRALLS
jgi:uncharacterized protein